MRFALCSLWLLISALWLSGIAVIAQLIGGYRWIAHMGQTRLVTMLALMATLCVASGLALLILRRIPKPLFLALVLASGLHLWNALGLSILAATNGHAGSVLVPFGIVRALLPTTTAFLGVPPGNFSVFILPGATFLLQFLSWFTEGPISRKGGDA